MGSKIAPDWCLKPSAVGSALRGALGHSSWGITRQLDGLLDPKFLLGLVS